jgi:propanol-preferring alcohol dehydrogenase
MRAMLFESAGRPLRLADVDPPRPAPDQLLIEVHACGVCRTDLHIAEGDLVPPRLPLVLGHEIVGEVIESGSEVDGFLEGTRVGVPWLGWTCGVCAYCSSGRENLCPDARFTGYHLDGGYAELTVASSRYCFRIPPGFGDVEAAPLLCAGLIGYRALRAAGDGRRLGLYGFGAAAHVIAQVARHEGRDVFAFTRAGDAEGQAFARRLGAIWAGDSDVMPPEALDAAIIFAPVGALVPLALRAVAPGGRVVCAGIHMSDIPSMPYELLWRERTICSVANLTREDGTEFFALAPSIPVRTTTVPLPLEQAGEALQRLAAGRLEGAAVLIP